MISAPAYDEDFYADDFIRDPWPHYARMRALGPVVWLPAHENYALVRHAEIAQALRDHATFISGKGVAASAFANEITRGNSAGSDGERHRAIRQATSAPLLPGALDKVRPVIDDAADLLIQRLSAVEHFDAVSDLATHLPLTIVRDLVGLPDSGRENMLRWANATFDLLGVQNARGKAALDVFLEQRRFAQTQTAAMLKPGSWTARLFDLVEKGALAPDLAPVSMRDYLNPSLDTTISATGQLIYQLGRNPDQWALLRARPELARNAVNEAVRMASPVRSFARHTSRDVAIGDVTIPEGARVMMVFASGNRDERVFENPDAFDITRSPRHHLGFGSGVHMCVGMHLAQMEMIALLEAMIPRVKRIEVGEPVIAMNNTIYGIGALPTRFVAETQAAIAPRRATQAAAAAPALLTGRIARREALTADIAAFEIEPVGDAFPAWTAGSHIDLHLREGLVRQYSLTGSPEDGRYRLAVQREANSRGGSTDIHARLSPGDIVTLSRPRNHFQLDETATRYLLLSGGIGLTPILSMAWRLHALGKAFAWHVSARSQAHLAWRDDLARLPFADRIVTHFDDAGDRVDVGRILSGHAAETTVYLCGPRGYMDHAVAAAGAAGVPKGRVRLEHFAAEIDVDGDPFVVVAAKSGRRIDVAANETILSALSRAGYRIETGCQNGVCGTCLTGVVDGRPDHRDMVLTEAEKAENHRIAVCCSRSQSPTLVLDI